MPVNIRTQLYQFYWKIESLLAPEIRIYAHLYEQTLHSLINTQSVWLDIGCGYQILPKWRSESEEALANNCKIVFGLDCCLDSIRMHRTILHRIKGDITELPCKQETFDIVTANMVVEHLDDPHRQFKEIVRILRPGGLFVLHTTNILGYLAIFGNLIPHVTKTKLIKFLEGRKQEDVFPSYYKVNTESRIRHLAETTGLEVATILMYIRGAEFVMIPPVVILELLLIRMLMMKTFRSLRTNIIAILRKPS